jgi:putative membrane protein
MKMQYIVYLTLMMTNIAAALFLLALYIFRGFAAENQKKWIPAFALSGGIALATGLHMIFVWPMPSVYNIAFGELSIMLGGLLVAGAWAIAKSWSFVPLGVYAFFASLAAVVVGVRFINLQISKEPLVVAAVLILTGVSGVLALPATFFYQRNPGLSRAIQWAAIIALVVAGGVLAFSAYTGYWDHLESFQAYKPA